MHQSFRALLACAALFAAPLHAKPIAYARGHTVMAEHGASMREAQWFYAPRYWWSAGVGLLDLRAEDDDLERRVAYARVNLLAKRWNLPAAQANVFVWGGLGTTDSDAAGSESVLNGGVQLDYETRRVYAALKSDAFESDGFSYRTATLQLGVAPYLHDWDTLATWVVVQARDYGGDAGDGADTALLLRLFKGGAWLEAGVDDDGKPVAMLMFNF